MRHRSEWVGHSNGTSRLGYECWHSHQEYRWTILNWIQNTNSCAFRLHLLLSTPPFSVSPSTHNYNGIMKFSQFSYISKRHGTSHISAYARQLMEIVWRRIQFCCFQRDIVVNRLLWDAASMLVTVRKASWRVRFSQLSVAVTYAQNEIMFWLTSVDRSEKQDTNKCQSTINYYYCSGNVFVCSLQLTNLFLMITAMLFVNLHLAFLPQPAARNLLAEIRPKTAMGLNFYHVHQGDVPTRRMSTRRALRKLNYSRSTAIASILWFNSMKFADIHARLHPDKMANALECLYLSEGIGFTGAARTCRVRTWVMAARISRVSLQMLDEVREVKFCGLAIFIWWSFI